MNTDLRLRGNLWWTVRQKLKVKFTLHWNYRHQSTQVPIRCKTQIKAYQTCAQMLYAQILIKKKLKGFVMGIVLTPLHERLKSRWFLSYFSWRKPKQSANYFNRKELNAYVRVELLQYLHFSQIYADRIIIILFRPKTAIIEVGIIAVIRNSNSIP